MHKPSVDTVSKKKRSEIMSKIRGKDTGPERMLRRIVSAAGVSFKSNHRVEGYRADLFFPSKKLVIFVDGCFWHGCPTCFKAPKTNKRYWSNKISENRKRDDRVNRTLRKAGWRVIHVWEHSIRYPEQVFLSKLMGAIISQVD